MRAHVIDNGVVVNTVEVAALDVLPGLVVAQGNEGIGWSYDGQDFTAPTQAPATVPQEITMRQARLALLDIGLLANVQTAINTLPEPDKTKAQIEWEYSNALQRDNPFVTTLGTALGLSSDDIDNLFITASGL